MNMNILAVVKKMSIYNGCCTRKTFGEEICTPVNMKICGCSNDRENRDINNSQPYSPLDTYLKSGHMYNMNITSSEPKDYLEI